MSVRTLLWAILASAIVSAPLAAVSMIIVPGDGKWSIILSHPGFWIYFARACGWYFLAGMLASVLTLFICAQQLRSAPGARVGQ